MLLGCPGQPCGPGKIYDCTKNCINASEVNNAVGDDSCDENLNCSEFYYDGGDCETTTTSIDNGGPTTIPTTTTTISGCDPDFVVDKYSQSVRRFVNDTGVCYAIYYSIKIENRGCAGEYYFKCTSDQWPTYSDCVVAFMEEGEARFIGPFLLDDMRFCNSEADLTFTIEIRNSRQSDFSQCKKPPFPIIRSPNNNADFITGEVISFEGDAKISYDGEITGNSLVWTSDLDGQIGAGTTFTRNDLSLGEHTIILTATDSFGETGVDDVSINIISTTSTTTIDPVVDISEMMVDIPGGTFEMGCADDYDDCFYEEYPQHTVTLSGFKMSKYEVTQGQWVAVMGSNPSWYDDCGLDCPVEDVDWNEVQDFIDELNRISGLNYRLPTEAEWEYAARAGTDTQWHCGSSESCLDSIAWYEDNSDGYTYPVGQKIPNEWGLFDMSGNVKEWVQDWYDINYYYDSPENNPTGPDSGTWKIVRGGSKSSDSKHCRSFYRGKSSDDFEFFDKGFRLVLSE
jgi:formylglycine-generating enzyme required for sulfatase activity